MNSYNKSFLIVNKARKLYFQNLLTGTAFAFPLLFLVQKNGGKIRYSYRK